MNDSTRMSSMPYECDSCKKTFIDTYQLNRHKARKTPCAPIVVAAVPVQGAAKNTKCKYCNRVYSSYISMRRHIRESCMVAAGVEHALQAQNNAIAAQQKQLAAIGANLLTQNGEALTHMQTQIQTQTSEMITQIHRLVASSAALAPTSRRPPAAPPPAAMPLNTTQAAPPPPAAPLNTTQTAPPPTVTAWWYHGATGTGKRSTARREHPGAYIKTRDTSWSRYAGEPTVIIDEWDPYIRMATQLLLIKDWSDKYPFKIPGESEPIRPTTIIVTSPFSIKQCFGNIHDTLLETMIRRFRVRAFPQAPPDAVPDTTQVAGAP